MVNMVSAAAGLYEWKRHAYSSIRFGLIAFALNQVAGNSMHIILNYHAAIPISQSSIHDGECAIPLATTFAERPW